MRLCVGQVHRGPQKGATFTSAINLANVDRFYRTRSIATVSRPSVRPSLCNVEVPWSYKLGSFENNQLKVFAPGNPNVGDLAPKTHAL